MFNSAKRAQAAFTKSANNVHPDYVGAPVPVANRYGPLVVVPYITDGIVAWDRSWAVMLGPVAFAKHSFGYYRVMRASRAAQFLWEV